jgi:hypothetical protein
MKTNYYKKIEEHLIKSDGIFRFGSIEDGGYYLNPKSITDSNFLFSGGISSNVEFEFDVFRFNKNIKIFMVDPTISPLKLLIKGFMRFLFFKKDKLKYIINNFMFIYMLRTERVWHIKKWLSAKNKIFSIISDKIDLKYDDKIILKLDIEGSEYELLDEIIENINLFNCMVFEFHDLHKKNELLIDFINNCKDRFNVVYLGINPSGGFDEFNNPKVIEISFERKP